MTTHRIVSVEIGRPRASGHETVVAVHTHEESLPDTRWSLRAVLSAMNSAQRFYTEALNGRQARVQRYTCAKCHTEHIRTHMSDAAIDDMQNHKHIQPTTVT